MVYLILRWTNMKVLMHYIFNEQYIAYFTPNESTKRDNRSISNIKSRNNDTIS